MTKDFGEVQAVAATTTSTPKNRTVASDLDVTPIAQTSLANISPIASGSNKNKPVKLRSPYEKRTGRRLTDEENTALINKYADLIEKYVTNNPTKFMVRQNQVIESGKNTTMKTSNVHESIKLMVCRHLNIECKIPEPTGYKKLTNKINADQTCIQIANDAAEELYRIQNGGGKRIQMGQGRGRKPKFTVNLNKPPARKRHKISNNPFRPELWPIPKS
jgi:hypothetical protein